MSEEQFSQYCAEKLEEMILAEGPDTVAAFIAEPVLGTGGIVPPPQGYWERIQPVLARYDILLVADEVITAFGRLGTMFGSDHYGIRPDLITVAKGMTSAYAPLSGVIVGDRVWQVLVRGSDQLGAIAIGREADLSIFDVVSGRWRFIDTVGQVFIDEQAIVPVQTSRGGELMAPDWGPHPWGWLPEQA